MYLAFGTNAFTRFPLVKAIEQIHAHGYDGVEILADAPHAFASTISTEEISKVYRVLQNTGIPVSNINANTATGFYPSLFRSGEVIFEPSLCSNDEETRRNRIEYTKQCIDLAVEWGATCISVTSGRSLPGNPPHTAYRNFYHSLNEVLDYAVKKDICVGIEYEPGLLIENSVELIQLFQDLPCPNLGVNLDIGHCQVIGEPLAETISKFSDKIWNVHLEDIRGCKHYHLVPGDGDIDFKEVLDALKSINYQQFITMELYTYNDAPDDAAKRSLSYLKDIISENGHECAHG
ncbi:sugar phosphate isomerase/epimerase [Aneurinibacillus sp. Ricciae_BoGa-3]|uniref:sugar phosphate isomerase/epimerase family protein n=1 Tax=Aneurinibacillus sp. Ricciae_BoGa-3 TaxID=3022697 RepID=UPI002341E2D6|nr:sugar phosphate isomerase/epimerase family protein [Aneurinibacillus sp. Ricciae_BoGa-3]WCK56301.1 sugar phosphate isomerase/epimerase [Aneurinibacillus sp. Ricciae_BoGa-3]